MTLADANPSLSNVRAAWPTQSFRRLRVPRCGICPMLLRKISRCACDPHSLTGVGLLLQFNGAREQQVVFEMDVLMQILREGSERPVERLITQTSVGGHC